MRSRATSRPKPPRYALPGAVDARAAYADALRDLGAPGLARLYLGGKKREKDVMVDLAIEISRLDERGQREASRAARNLMILSAFLHEAKHDHPASADALRAFWLHLRRIRRA